MSRRLTLSIGQHSDKGRKDTNQDFHGALTPEEPLLSLKGIALALADNAQQQTVILGAPAVLPGDLTAIEAALRAANAKFERRFAAMEADAGERFAALPLEEKEELWQAAKRRGL